MEHRPLAPDLVIPSDRNTCGNKCAGESAPDVASRELRQEKQVGGPVNCSDSELCTFLQALGEGYLPTFYSDTSQCVQSKSMSIASRSYQRGKKTVSFHGFQSLQMSRNLTDDRGAELLTWFLEGFRVRTFQSQARGQDSPASAADCGRKWRASFARYSRDSRSWKTAQCSLLEGLDEFSETWPKWGLMRNGECLERPIAERPTCESESGLWPTPTCWGGGQTLPEGTTPTGKTPEGRKQTVCLELYVQQVERKVWPTPTVAMAKGSSGGALTRKTGKSRENDRLDYAVEGDAKNGRLNPTWVEWLMGWPLGWTELQPLETGRFREWLAQHGGF